MVALCAACAALAWVAWRLDSRVDALEERLASAGGAGRAVSRSMFGAQIGARVDHDSFRGLWLPTYGPVAEERCWRGFTTAQGAAPPDAVQFYLSLGPGGEVTRVEPDLSALQGVQVAPGFPECLAQIIRGMRFPATGEAYMTPVRAERPRPASRPAP